MYGYLWPGNVRELSNAIESCIYFRPLTGPFGCRTCRAAIGAEPA